MSAGNTFELECDGEVVIIERVPSGEHILHNYDREAREAAIALGFDRNECDTLYETINGGHPNGALMDSIEHGSARLIEALIFIGATVHAWSSSALSLAATHGRADIAALLIDDGAEVDADDGDALRTATDMDDLGVITVLINAGADVNVKGGDPLFIAATWGYLEIAKMLVAAGAVPTWKMINKADENDHEEVALFLEDEYDKRHRKVTTLMSWRF